MEETILKYYKDYSYPSPDKLYQILKEEGHKALTDLGFKTNDGLNYRKD